MQVVVAATDPNPTHSGRGFRLLKRAGIKVVHGILADEAVRLNEAFNHWIVHRTPFITVKAAMTLDGKIATAAGESKWITGPKARAHGMQLRQEADAILVGITTLLVEGGGEVNASFLLGGLAHRVAFFYAPTILGGRGARKGVAGGGINRLSQSVKLRGVEWRWLGPDL